MLQKNCFEYICDDHHLLMSHYLNIRQIIILVNMDSYACTVYIGTLTYLCVPCVHEWLFMHCLNVSVSVWPGVL